MTTQPDLPEGILMADVLEHVAVIGAMGTLINLCGTYMGAEEGSPEEDTAEEALAEGIERVVATGPDAMKRLLMSFLSLIVAEADEARVQAWFDFQAAKIAEVLDGTS